MKILALLDFMIIACGNALLSEGGEIIFYREKT